MGKTASPILRSAAALIAALWLAACATSQQDVSSYLVSPGKYDIYTCPQIADEMQTRQTTLAKLEGLMARAKQGSGGDFISDIAYEPEFQATRGELNELQKSAVAKNCKNLPAQAAPRQSDAAVQ